MTSFCISATFSEVLGNVQKFVAILGLASVMVAVFRYLIDRKKENFKGLMEKIKVAKYNSTQKCFASYKEENKELLADSKALIIDKNWGYWADKDKPWIHLDKVKVTVAAEKPAGVEKAIKHPPYPQKFKPFSIRKSYVKEMLRYGCTPTIFFNGDIYCASEFAVEKDGQNPALKVYEAGYFDFFNTCKVKEFRYEVGKKRSFKVGGEAKKNSNIFNLENRACGIGVVTLTVIRLEDGEDGLFFLMHKRGDKVAEGSGTVHVVPAGSFQPFTSFEEKSTATLSSTVYREFCEEVLSTTDMRELTSESFLTANVAYNFIVRPNTSKLYFLGAGLDPYNTKMEIMSLLFIDLRDENKLKDFIKYATKGDEKGVPEKNDPMKNAFDSKKNRLKAALKKASDTEGSIVLEKFKESTLEEYFGNINIVPAAKELMYIAYKRFKEIQGLEVDKEPVPVK